MSDLLTGFELFVAGALLGPFITRSLTVRRRVRAGDRQVERAWADHQAWYDEAFEAYRQELSALRADFAECNMTFSGGRVQAESRLLQRYQRELRDHLRKTMRETEDATADWTPLEWVYFRWANRKGHELPESFESRMGFGVFGRRADIEAEAARFAEEDSATDSTPPDRARSSASS